MKIQRSLNILCQYAQTSAINALTITLFVDLTNSYATLKSSNFNACPWYVLTPIITTKMQKYASNAKKFKDARDVALMGVMNVNLDTLI